MPFHQADGSPLTPSLVIVCDLFGGSIVGGGHVAYMLIIYLMTLVMIRTETVILLLHQTITTDFHSSTGNQGLVWYGLQWSTPNIYHDDRVMQCASL